MYCLEIWALVWKIIVINSFFDWPRLIPVRCGCPNYDVSKSCPNDVFQHFTHFLYYKKCWMCDVLNDDSPNNVQWPTVLKRRTSEGLWAEQAPSDTRPRGRLRLTLCTNKWKSVELSTHRNLTHHHSDNRICLIDPATILTMIKKSIEK